MFGLGDVGFGIGRRCGELRRWLSGRVVSCSGDVLGTLRERTKGAKGLELRLAKGWNDEESH